MKPFAAMRLRQSGPPPAWTPASLTDLRNWYVSDNSANTLVSGELSVLADKSGNGNTATTLSGSSGNRAVLVASGLNGRTIWRSDSVSKRGFFIPAGNSTSSGASGLTLAVVHRTNPAQGTTDLNVLRINTNPGTFARSMIGRGRSANSNSVYAGGRRLDADSFAYAEDTTDQSNNWIFAVAVFDYANAAAYLSVNGTLTSNLSFQTAGTVTAANASSQGLGHNGIGSTGSAAYGDYGEALITRSAAGTGDRQKLEGYLAWQWGLEANLPSGHPYKSAPP